MISFYKQKTTPSPKQGFLFFYGCSYKKCFFSVFFLDEPEDAYLLTWFELVNQKNVLLRRENELIYM